ncbi:large ribosomal subunit protein uL29m isoform X1 [Hydra vulgaris]|uniref:Large ribosomal subunit protein uL29m n=1 Tax=Hydra vulgaris TaxID=6087 RepID=T2M502_HYDVU|nr:39S ribosomal protein L47, mitochondrial [Hydra vulgaris]
MLLKLLQSNVERLLSLPIHFARPLSTTSKLNSLAEFFPPGVYDSDKFVEENPNIGRKWKKSELRIRSNSDLHKFWYVLLKEKNMLLTMRQEAKRLGIPVPGPTRLDKVNKSMLAVKSVIKERNDAILQIEKERRFKFDPPPLPYKMPNKAVADKTNNEKDAI